MGVHEGERGAWVYVFGALSAVKSSCQIAQVFFDFYAKIIKVPAAVSDGNAADSLFHPLTGSHQMEILHIADSESTLTPQGVTGGGSLAASVCHSIR